MSFSVGIVGLPNVGKSTLFKALTKQQVAISSRPFTTIDPNIGIVSVPDKRLLEISKAVRPEKTTPTTIKFIDIAGLIKDAHKGEGLGNQFLAHIRNCDAILNILRVFNKREIENVLGEINPQKEIEVIKTELLMKDLETLEGLILKKQKELKKDKKALKEANLLKEIKEFVSSGNLISTISLGKEEKEKIKEYQFLTEKPIIYLLNTNKKISLNFEPKIKYLEINLKEEEEISELSEKDLQELGLKSQLDELITACYNVLDLITFFTIKGKKEARAWTIKKGGDVKTAAGKIHSDFEEKFIKAEVISWEKFLEVGSWLKAKEKGWLQVAGKNYLLQDGDIIEIKF